ncbi:MAG: hypothetical protein WCV90_09080 [Candidatus Woesearchaeota archaeon]|jgi:hypothetical protein
METNQKITYGLIGFLTVVMAAFGGTVYLSPDQLDHAYVCSVTESVAFFDKLSSTFKTGYYTDDQGAVKSIVCKNGTWISLKSYAASKGVSIDSLLQKNNDVQTSSQLSYRCDKVECKVIS